MQDGDGQSEPRMTLQSQAELEGLQYLEDTDKTLSSLRHCPRFSEVFKKYSVALRHTLQLNVYSVWLE